MRPRQEDLRPALLPAYVVHIGADAVARPEGLARDQFVAPHHGLAAAEVDDDIAVFDPLDDAVDDVADAVLVFFVLPVALGLADLLDDDLLGRLGRDASEVEGRQGFGDPVADLGGWILAARIGHRDLCGVVLDLVDHQQQPGEAQLAGLGVDLRPDLGFLSVAGSGRLLDGLFHRAQHDLAIDRFLARHRIGDL